MKPDSPDTNADLAAALTEGTLLGRVRYTQPRDGHRTGIEPVLLAAAVPARAGQRVLEAGTGAGAALLCLTTRVPGVCGVGVEIVPRLAALARRNFAAADPTRLHVLAGDITQSSLTPGVFEHAMANPPWHHPSGTASGDADRETARRAYAGLVGAWTAALARAVRHRGTVTLIGSVGIVPEFLAAARQAGLGSPCVLPLWPRAGHEAKLALMQAVRAGHATLRLPAGMVLHEADGGYTAAAASVLRDAAALPLGLRPARSRSAGGTAPTGHCRAAAPRESS